MTGSCEKQNINFIGFVITAGSVRDDTTSASSDFATITGASLSDKYDLGVIGAFLYPTACKHK